MSSSISSSSKESIKPTIYTVNALAGSGKTYQAISYAIEQAQLGNKICIIQPTKDLIEQSYKDACSRALTQLTITRYHEDVLQGIHTVSTAIMNHLEHPAPCGEIVFITHAAFFAVPYFHNPSEWILICDEIPNVVETEDLNISETHNLITDELVTRDVDPLHYLIEPKDRQDKDSVLVTISQNRNKDDLYETLRPLVWRLVSFKHRVFVKKENWDRILKGKTKNGKFKLTAHSVLQHWCFKKFQKVLLMGAMFDQTLLYKLWKHKVNFEPFREIEDKLRFSRHTIKGSVVFKYFTETAWSKRYYSKEVNGQSILKHYEDRISEEFKNETFIYAANNSIPILFKKLQSRRLSGSPHGLNHFQEFDNVAFLSALNPIPATFSFLDSKWISDDELIISVMYHSCYQAIMRSSLRNPDTDTKRIIIVPSRGMAEWLAGYFENSSIEKLPNVPELPMKINGRPRKALKLNGTDRSRRSRSKASIQEVLELEENQKNCNENPIGPYSLSVAKNSSYENEIKIQLFSSIYGAPDLDLVRTFQNESELAVWLEELSQRNISTKEDNFLICPATFGEEMNDKGQRSKCLSNVKSAWGVWIDIDDGDMTPDDFMHVFPQLKMYVFNTFSGGNRYRILIPTTHYMTPYAYKDIHKSLLAGVEKSTANYVATRDENDTMCPVHGWDLTKTSAGSLFYAPCRAITDNNESYFVKKEGVLLDVIEYLKKPLHIKPRLLKKTRVASVLDVTDRPVTEREIHACVDDYKGVPVGAGLRHAAFYKLARRLYSLGLELVDIRQHLLEADYDGSRQKANEIEDALSSLRKSQSRNLVDYKYTEKVYDDEERKSV